MLDILEFKDMIIDIFSDGCQIAILLAVSERAVNMFISFVVGDKRIKF